MSHDDTFVADAIRAAAAQVRAPERLRVQLAAQRARRTRHRRTAGALVATLATALAAVLALAHPAGEPGPPSIADAAAIALRAPTLPAPARDARAPELLRASAGGVRFPDYAYGRLGWRADGLRRARRGGRDVIVVSYARGAGGPRAGYAIVAGPALGLTAGAPRIVRRGVQFAVLRDAGATIVTWRRSGHTCVLASRDAPAGMLLRLAAWRADDGSHGPY
jgi:hypothetical protein